MKLFSKKKVGNSPLVPLAFYSKNGGNAPQIITLATVAPEGEICIESVAVEDVSAVLAEWSRMLGVNFTPIETRYLTVVGGFSEYSRLLPLPNEAPQDLSLLPSWMVSAVQRGTVGMDGMPLFENSLDTHAACLAIGEKGSVVLSSTPREIVGRAVSQLLFTGDGGGISAGMISDDNLRLLVNVETPARAAARCVVSSLSPDSLADGEMLVFLVVTEEGNCIAFYDRERGLFFESASLLNPLDMETSEQDKGMFSDVTSPLGAADILALAATPQTEIAAFAADRLRNLLRPDRFEDLGITRVKQIYLLTDETLESELREELGEYAEWLQAALELRTIDETIVEGLLLGLHNSAESFAVATVPPINFANDLYSQAVNQESEESLELDRQAVRRRNSVVLALAVPVILILGLVFGWWLTEFRRAAALDRRESDYQKEKRRLEPKIQARASYEKNLKWYHEYLTQIYELRLRQGTALSLFSDLNERYPLALDESFYIAELKLSSNGQLEMRGLAREEQAFTAFVRSLETSESVPGTDRRLFANLTPDFGQGVKISAPSNSLLQTTAGGGANNQIAANLPPGVVGWRIGGIYSPVAMLKPLTSAPANNQPPNPANPNQSQPNQNPAANQPNNPNGGNK